MMRRQFEISISSKPRPHLEGPATNVGAGSRIKALMYGFAALILISIIFVIGFTLGTAVFVTMGVLVIAALAVLAVRGAFGRT
jgi:hypothetical protein